MKKKSVSFDSSSEETLQSLRSWIRKIEQSTTSVSARLTAVERRFTVENPASNAANQVSMQGPIETFIRNGKKRNAGDLGRLLDGELMLLHNEVVKQNQELLDLKTHLTGVEERHTALSHEIHSVRTIVMQLNEKIIRRQESMGRSTPFMMRVGTMEIPVEFTGIIGGALAFTIAALVMFNQKAVLLSPIFLSAVGLLLIGSAMLKMVRAHSRVTMRPLQTMPVPRGAAQFKSMQCEQKEG